MPAAKPVSLQTKHLTKDELDVRVMADDSMQSKNLLPEREPYALKDHKIAAKVWRRTVKEFNELEAQILTEQDRDLLMDYCLAMGEMNEMVDLRRAAFRAYSELTKMWDKAKKEHDDAVVLSLTESIVDSFTAIKNLDARVDQKRKYLLTVRQSLYLTPRSRTGQAPKQKDNELPKDPMEELFKGKPVFVREDQSSEQGDGQ